MSQVGVTDGGCDVMLDDLRGGWSQAEARAFMPCCHKDTCVRAKGEDAIVSQAEISCSRARELISAGLHQL